MYIAILFIIIIIIVLYINTKLDIPIVALLIFISTLFILYIKNKKYYSGGTTYNNYTILKKLNSQGNLSTVYLAKKLNTVYIIKEVDISTSELYNNILNEIKINTIAGNLDVGPKIYEHWINNNKLYIVMQYIEGVILEQYIKINNSIDIQLFEKLKTKLQLLHDNNIAHHDLHIGNIIILLKNDIPTDIYIIDYGHSKLNDNTLSTHDKDNFYRYIAADNERLNFLEKHFNDNSYSWLNEFK